MVKKVVTVMNYPDRTNENIMCITWMKKTREHFPNDFKIEILYEKNISNLIKKYAKKFNITLKKADRSHEIDFTGHPDCIKASHNVNFKLYNLCKLNDSFIFLDADAFILHSSDDLIEASKTKEFIAINHQNIPGQTDMLSEPVLNSGVMVINNTDLFNWDIFKKILFRDKKFVYPGTDQSLINSRFKEDNIDYTHTNVGFGWNSWSKYTVWENNKAFCKGLEKEHPVFINHYWNEAKPWNINCPVYNDSMKEVFLE